MQAFKVGKLVTFVAIIILLVVAILSPYNLFKRFILLLVFLLLAQFHLVQINSLNWYTVNLIRNDITGLRGTKLVHHHIVGGQAVGVPLPLHPGFGGIHNAEKSIGAWGKDAGVEPPHILMQHIT